MAEHRVKGEGQGIGKTQGHEEISRAKTIRAGTSGVKKGSLPGGWDLGLLA